MDKTLTNLCRLCGDERIYSFDVFMKTEDNVVLCEIIKDILNITITEDDTIPHEICALCHTFLINFLKFRDTAEKTQLFLIDLGINLEKEKTAAKIERHLSVDSVKSESNTGSFDEAPEAISHLSCSSDDILLPCIQTAAEENPLKKQKSCKKPLNETKSETIENPDSPTNSFSSDDDYIPLIKVARENSAKKKMKTGESSEEDVHNKKACTITRQDSHRSVELTIENPLDNPEECNICQKKFTKERYLRHHLRVTHKIIIESNYPCNRCTRKFMQKISWERHQQLHDDPIYNRHVKCHICDKFYINKQTLKAHIRSIHVDIGKKYVCEECGAQFKGISSLKTHKITHTGEFPFECMKCDRRFQSKANLFVHLDTHTETPYVCEVCHKPSTTLRGLRLHMVNHSDEKPHKCHMCGNAYKRVTALKKHLIVHSGIRPYSCNFCERTFADGSNKRIHMRRVHKKELAEMEASGLKVIPAVLPKIQQLREDGGAALQV